MNNVITFPHAEARLCLHCEEAFARLRYVDEQFAYGAGSEHVVLSVRVPVWSCDRCGTQYTDGDAEDLRHAAICRHLGKLTPSEILSLREKYQMSQQEWASKTGIGIASVKRWESGSLIQGDVADRFMRLLFDTVNFERVASLGLETPGSPQDFQFQNPLSAEVDACAEKFVLRKA